MNCTRCEQYPCRCTDSRDVIAEYYAQRSPPPDPERAAAIARMQREDARCTAHGSIACSWCDD